ncbi:MAG: ParB/RepB/Spo0J family partition protein [Patescibacteria group bacterium]
MSAAKRGLGRGLEALLPDTEPKRDVPIADIVLPDSQPRRRFVEQGIMQLAASLKHHGVLQPLVVAKDPDAAEPSRFRLIAGERRLRAAKLAGLSHVPVFIRDDDDQRHFELALIENLQRSDLSPLEEAGAYERLLAESGLTQDALAKRLGVGRAKIALALRLLKLPADARRALEEGAITAGHAQAILSADPERRGAVLAAITARGLSVRAAERLAKEGSVIRKTQTQEQPEWTAELSRILGAKVRVTGSAGKGTLSISYHSADELDRIVGKLRRD